jgi:hypothetical protein
LAERAALVSEPLASRNLACTEVLERPGLSVTESERAEWALSRAIQEPEAEL